METKRINVADIMRDIRRGLGDVPIMEKYDIAPSEYMNILERLNKSQQLRGSNLEARMIKLRTGLEKEDTREAPRCYLVVMVRVADSTNPARKGVVLDLSENGCQVAGIQCHVGEIKKFRIQIEGVEGQSVQCRFTAECRWEKKNPADGSALAGFEIKNISQIDREHLHNIIELIALCDA